MKRILFEYINEQITPARERYVALLEAPNHIEEQLQEGAKKARAVSAPFLQELREAVGITKISG
jgi:tryptophanyl-tRNA synthetase